MEYQLYKNIVCNPDICNGKPTIKGTRVTVKCIIGEVRLREKDKKILKSFPRISAEDLQVCKDFNSMFFEKASHLKTMKI